MSERMLQVSHLSSERGAEGMRRGSANLPGAGAENPGINRGQQRCIAAHVPMRLSPAVPWNDATTIKIQPMLYETPLGRKLDQLKSAIGRLYPGPDVI
jgi:hypothetical protein